METDESPDKTVMEGKYKGVIRVLTAIALTWLIIHVVDYGARKISHELTLNGGVENDGLNIGTFLEFQDLANIF